MLASRLNSARSPPARRSSKRASTTLIVLVGGKGLQRRGAWVLIGTPASEGEPDLTLVYLQAGAVLTQTEDPAALPADQDLGMPRLALLAMLATTLLLPVSVAAAASRAHAAHAAPRSTATRVARRHAPTGAASSGRLAARNPMALALALAERYWGAVPCGGRIVVALQSTVPAGLDRTSDAWVTFDSALGVNDLAAPPASYSHCTIGLARSQWPTAAAMRSDWGMFCLTVTHELGHLLGRSHSLAPGSVMAPVFTNESNVPSICRTSAP
jgi:hypothetical protein